MSEHLKKPVIRIHPSCWASPLKEAMARMTIAGDMDQVPADRPTKRDIHLVLAEAAAPEPEERATIENFDWTLS